MKHLVVMAILSLIYLTCLTGSTLKVVLHDMCPPSVREFLRILDDDLEDVSFNVMSNSDFGTSLYHLRGGEIDVLITFNRLVTENFRKSLPLSSCDFMLFGKTGGKIGTLRGFEGIAFARFGSDEVEIFEDLSEIEMLFSKRYLTGAFLPEGVFKKSDVETKRYDDQAVCVMFYGNRVPDRTVNEIISAMLKIYQKFSFAQSLRRIKIQVFDSLPNCYKDGGGICGIDAEIIEKLFNRLGYTVDLVSYPTRRAFNMMRDGLIDGGFPVEKNAFTESFLRFVDVPLRTGSDVLFTLAGLREGFEPKRRMFENCGFVKDYQHVDIIKPFCRNTFAVNNIKVGMNLLKVGRVDALVENYSEGLYEASNIGLSVTYSRPLRTYKMYIAISDKSPHVALVPFLNELLRDITSDH